MAQIDVRFLDRISHRRIEEAEKSGLEDARWNPPAPLELVRPEQPLRAAIAHPLRCWTLVLILEGRPGPFRDDLRFVAQRVPWLREIPRWPSVFGRLRRCGQSALTLAEESLARHLYRQIDKGGHERRLDAGLYGPEGRPMC
jgi:hypothetical protein